MLSTAEFGKRHGVSDSTVRTWIRDGLPKERKGRGYRIDPKTGDPWVDKHARNTARRKPLTIDLAKTKHRDTADGGDGSSAGAGGRQIAAEDAAASPPAPPGMATDASPLRRELAHLERVIDALIAAMETGNLSPKAWRLYESSSKRRAELLKQKRAEEEADGRLMDREAHKLAIGTISAAVRSEIETASTSVPDQVLDAMTEGGLRVVDADGVEASRSAIRLASAAIEEAARKQLERIAARIRDAADADLERQAG